MTQEPEHVPGEDGQFHVEHEAVDVSIYGWEDRVTFALFWIMAAVVFYQVFRRYVLSDSAGWTEEIARYFLVAVVFTTIAILPWLVPLLATLFLCTYVPQIVLGLPRRFF
jgi:hypothetical protein